MKYFQICFVSSDGKLETCSCSDKNCGCQDDTDKTLKPNKNQSTSTQKFDVENQKNTKPIAKVNSTYTYTKISIYQNINLFSNNIPNPQDNIHL